jgi:hypothetical protein
MGTSTFETAGATMNYGSASLVGQDLNQYKSSSDCGN